MTQVTPAERTKSNKSNSPHSILVRHQVNIDDVQNNQMPVYLWIRNSDAPEYYLSEH